MISFTATACNPRSEKAPKKAKYAKEREYIPQLFTPKYLVKIEIEIKPSRMERIFPIDWIIVFVPKLRQVLFINDLWI